MGANSFHYGMIPIYMGGNNENDRSACPESVTIHLKLKNNQLTKVTNSKRDFSLEKKIFIHTFCSNARSDQWMSSPS